MDTLAHRVGIAAVALGGAYACSRPCHASATSTAQWVQPPAWASKSKSSTDDTGGCREPAAADVTSSPKDGPITTGLLPGATERVGFKWWTPQDGARARALWGDARVTALIGGPFDDEAVSERLRAEVHRASTEGVQYWPVFLKVKNNWRTPKHLGCAGLRLWRGDAAALIRQHPEPPMHSSVIYEIGVHLMPAYWGRGLAAEVATAVLAHAFDVLQAGAVFAGHHPDNTKSKLLIQSLGMKFWREEFYPPTGRMHPSYVLTAAAWNRSRPLPPHQVHPAAWLGPAMAAQPGTWTWRVSASEAAQIHKAACAALKTLGSAAVLKPSDFPLSLALTKRLDRLRHELIDGRGFELLRGLPLHTWPRELAAAAFLGLGAHLGTLRSQNGQGHLLGHVRDLGLCSDNPNVRIYQTSERQTFHADSCDIVALACLQDAKKGGESLLCSTLSVWNEIIKRGRGDLARALLVPVAIDRRGEVPVGKQPFFMMPPMYFYEGRLGPGAGYQRQYIDSAQSRFPAAPRLSTLQIEALDLFDTLLDDPTLHMSMRMQPGDIQFV